MKPSPRSRSTGPSRRAGGRPRPLDVYLLPAVVGGGRGDVEETLAAGRRLEAAGATVWLYRRPGRPWPREVEGPWAWPPRLRRTSRLRPGAPAALTIAPAWGLSAAPERDGPLGRPGPWSEEAADIEHRYGPASTLHLSLEEFARNLPLAREHRERFREGGVRSRAIPDRLRRWRATDEPGRFREAFERFRAFDRPNVLHLFATFRPDPGFAADFPAAVQTGPLWPHRYAPATGRRPARGRRRWVWYASPASSERIAPSVLRGLSGAPVPVELSIRSPRAWTTPPEGEGVRFGTAPLPTAEWERAFRTADLRIVTGSRTLLEALEVGGPFLYFNGVLGEGSARHRHRPEKIVAWLAAERDRLAPDLARDLRDFASGRRVGAVVRRAAAREGGWLTFPDRTPRPAFRPPFDDAGTLAVAVGAALARAPTEAAHVVARVRRGSNP